MSCSCGSTPYLSKKDVLQAAPKVLKAGDTDSIPSVKVFQNDGANGVVSPTQLVLSDLQLNIYSCLDIIDPVLVSTPTSTAISDGVNTVGYELSYILDTSALEAGKYIAIYRFKATIGSKVYSRQVPMFFNIVSIDCIDFSACQPPK